MWISPVTHAQKHYRHRRLLGTQGYSLFELVTALSIFGIIATIAVPHFDSRRMQIITAQRLLISKLRAGRAAALTKGVHYRLEFTTANQVSLQPMKLVNNAWVIDAQNAQSIPLPSTTQLPTNLVGSNIEFNTRGIAVNLTQPQKISVTDTFGVTKSLQAWPSGQVNEL